MPTVTAEIRFAAGASSTGFELGSAILGLSTLGAAVSYTDVSSDVRSLQVSRGKQRELDEYSTGGAALVLDNRDRDFDPNYTSSPYYPNVTIGRWLRLKATHPTTGVEYTIYKGTIREWMLNYNFPNEATATARATDFLEDLNNTNITTTTSAALSGTVVSEILNAANILPRDLDAGQGTFQAVTLTDTAALSALQIAAQSEGGGSSAIYCNEEGQVVYEDRQSLSTNTRSNTSQGTFGTAALPIDEVELDYSSDLIKNDISLTRIGGTAQTKTDTDSQDNYGIRSFTIEGLYNQTDGDVGDNAQLYLDSFAEPELRVRKITLNPRMNADLMTQALSRQIRDRITVSYEPPPSGTAVTQDMFISGIEHRMRAEEFQTVFTLESTAGRSPYWVLGLSELGTSTKLGF